MRNYQLKLNDRDFSVQLRSFSKEAATLEINGKEYRVSISAVSEVIPESAGLNMMSPALVAAPVSAPQAASASEGAVLAPIPGAIVDVYVQSGDEVKAGQPLFKMEAMKMENEINSRIDGVVVAVNISVGDSVNQGDELVVISP